MPWFFQNQGPCHLALKQTVSAIFLKAGVLQFAVPCLWIPEQRLNKEKN